MTPLLDLDRAVTTWIAAQCASPWVQWPLAIVTTAGVGATVWYAIALVGLVRASRHRPDRHAGYSHVAGACWRAILAISIALALVDGVVKPLVRRDRPFVNGPAPSALAWRPTTSSFPSGHAASSAAGALTLARAFPPATVPLTVLAVLIAFSRVGLGMHYTGDVLAGALLGLAVAAFVSPRVPPRPGDDR